MPPVENGYTRPRGPVGAMYSGPGPIYALPSLVGQSNHDPRSNHARGPAYPFTLSRTSFYSNKSDGPGPWYVEPKLSRTGRDSAPAYTIASRWKNSGENERLPGPSDYVCLNPYVLAGRSRSPAYSFGTSRRAKDKDVTPGPNQYSTSYNRDKPLESRLKRAPSYTIVGRRSELGANDVTPGPGHYPPTNSKIYLKRPPAYTIAGKYGSDTEAENGPSPLSYQTNKVWVHKRESPSYTFGIRHSPYKANLIKNEIDI